MKFNRTLVRNFGWILAGSMLLQTTTVNPTATVLDILQRITAFLTLTITQAFQYAIFPQGLTQWTFYGAQYR